MHKLWIPGEFMRFLAYIICCEALTHLLFNGQILQPLRNFFIKNFLWLTFEEEHLLECKYCTSVWMGIILGVLYTLDNFYVNLFVYCLTLHRCSNWVHLLFSFIHDKQLDIRINRRKNHGL